MYDKELEQSLSFLIKRTSRAFRARLNQVFNEGGYDITSEQWRILRCLWYQDGQIQQNLADFVHKDKTCITRIIDSMEKRNLVVRIPDKEDRRQKLVYLTSKGKELREESIKLVQQVSMEAQKDIDPDHIDILMKVLEKICSNLSSP